MDSEYRLVATKPDGREKRWPKRNLAHAEKTLKDLTRDIAHTITMPCSCGDTHEWQTHPGLTGYQDPRIEQREVTAWHTVSS